MSQTSHKEVEKINQIHKLCRVGLVQTLKLQNLPSWLYFYNFPLNILKSGLKFQLLSSYFNSTVKYLKEPRLNQALFPPSSYHQSKISKVDVSALYKQEMHCSPTFPRPVGLR